MFCNGKQALWSEESLEMEHKKYKEGFQLLLSYWVRKQKRKCFEVKIYLNWARFMFIFY